MATATTDPVRLPPGPRGPKTVQGLAFLTARQRVIAALSRRYGGAFTVNLPIFGRTVVVGDPLLVKDLFSSGIELLGRPKHTRSATLSVPDQRGVLTATNSCSAADCWCRHCTASEEGSRCGVDMAPDDRRGDAARTQDRAAHHFGPRASNARTELDLERPFAELGLNSVMAMSIRRQAERLVRVELSLTMLWNQPTIASLAEYLAGKFSPQEGSATINGTSASASSVLDALFDSVQSAS